MKYLVSKMSVTQKKCEITFTNCVTGKNVVEYCFNTELIELMISLLMYQPVTVLGKTVIRIHNNKHYKLFCLYYIDPDFGEQYCAHWSPFERLHQAITFDKR